MSPHGLVVVYDLDPAVVMEGMGMSLVQDQNATLREVLRSPDQHVERRNWQCCSVAHTMNMAERISHHFLDLGSG